MPLGIDISAPQGVFPCRANGVEYEGKIKKAQMSPGRRHLGLF
jgi:hypothetical protein